MRIKVQFDCEEKYLAEISEGLLSVSQGVMAQPTRSYNNYFAMYAGDMSTIESMNNFLRGYHEKDKVTYFEIGHFL